MVVRSIYERTDDPFGTREGFDVEIDPEDHMGEAPPDSLFFPLDTHERSDDAHFDDELDFDEELLYEDGPHWVTQ